MGSVTDPPKPLSTRHKCIACFKQYKKKEHLVEHIKTSYHSVHQPKCGICKKHCRTFESLREHVTGLLSKDDCSKGFAELGCKLCLKVFNSPIILSQHKWTCPLTPPTRLGAVAMPKIEVKSSLSEGPKGLKRKLSTEDLTREERPDANCPRIPEAVAIDCEMVGGGSDGTVSLCARVCLIDENENILFHTYVQPQLPITDYRCKVTGLTEELLKDAMPLKEVQEKVQAILYNGESIGIARIDGGKARLLVGHSLDHDLNCLCITYPDHLIRDTAKYHPLMKTNLVSFSLKHLTKMYLGYDIQMGIHDPYEDCVSVMRLYKRMRNQDHLSEMIGSSLPRQVTEFENKELDSYQMQQDLEKMTTEELYNLSSSNYRCWCLDSIDPKKES